MSRLTKQGRGDRVIVTGDHLSYGETAATPGISIAGAIRRCIPSLLLELSLTCLHLLVPPAPAGTLMHLPVPARRTATRRATRVNLRPGALRSCHHMHGQFVLCHVHQTSFCLDTQDHTQDGDENLLRVGKFFWPRGEMHPDSRISAPAEPPTDARSVRRARTMRSNREDCHARPTTNKQTVPSWRGC